MSAWRPKDDAPKDRAYTNLFEAMVSDAEAAVIETPDLSDSDMFRYLLYGFAVPGVTNIEDIYAEDGQHPLIDDMVDLSVSLAQIVVLLRGDFKTRVVVCKYTIDDQGWGELGYAAMSGAEIMGGVCARLSSRLGNISIPNYARPNSANRKEIIDRLSFFSTPPPVSPAIRKTYDGPRIPLVKPVLDVMQVTLEETSTPTALWTHTRRGKAAIDGVWVSAVDSILDGSNDDAIQF